MRLKALRSIQHNGTEFAPGKVFEVDKAQAERLIKLGAAIESGEPVTGGAPVEDLKGTLPQPPTPVSAPASSSAPQGGKK